MNGIGTIHIKMFDGVVRDLTEVRYVPQMKKNIISIGAVESKRTKSDIGEWCSQGHEGVYGCNEGDRR